MSADNDEDCIGLCHECCDVIETLPHVCDPAQLAMHEGIRRGWRLEALERAVIEAAVAWDTKYKDHLRDCGCERCQTLSKATAALIEARGEGEKLK